MNSINAFSANSASASQMISELFGGKAVKPVDLSVAQPATSSSVSKQVAPVATKTSSATSSAISNLDAPDPFMSANDSNKLVAAAQSMTTQQLSDAYYGSGVQVTGYVNSYVNFGDLLNGNRETVADERAAATDPTQAAQADRLLSLADTMEAVTDSMQAAYDNHTMTFQKASDVAGLNYTGTDADIFVGPNDGNSGGVTAAYSQAESWDQNFVTNNPDGKQHTMADAGNGVLMYVSW